MKGDLLYRYMLSPFYPSSVVIEGGGGGGHGQSYASISHSFLNCTIAGLLLSNVIINIIIRVW